MKHKRFKVLVVTALFMLILCTNVFAASSGLYNDSKTEYVNNVRVTLRAVANYEYVDGYYAKITQFSAAATCGNNCTAYQTNIGHSSGECSEGATGWANFDIRSNATGTIIGVTGVNLYISIYGETTLS